MPLCDTLPPPGRMHDRGGEGGAERESARPGEPPPPSSWLPNRLLACARVSATSIGVQRHRAAGVGEEAVLARCAVGEVAVLARWAGLLGAVSAASRGLMVSGGAGDADEHPAHPVAARQPAINVGPAPSLMGASMASVTASAEVG